VRAEGGGANWGEGGGGSCQRRRSSWCLLGGFYVALEAAEWKPGATWVRAKDWLVLLLPTIYGLKGRKGSGGAVICDCGCCW
jgi:hypothetical protein